MKTPVRWFHARYRGVCKTPGCRALIAVGDLVFCPPSSKAVKCRACGETSTRISSPRFKPLDSSVCSGGL